MARGSIATDPFSGLKAPKAPAEMQAEASRGVDKNESEAAKIIAANLERTSKERLHLPPSVQLAQNGPEAVATAYASRKSLSQINTPAIGDLRQMNPEQFNQSMRQFFVDVGESMPHVREALAKMQRLGYSFAAYNAEDGNISQATHSLMRRGTIGASTDHGDQKIYLNLDNIEKFTATRRSAEALRLVMIAADESVHILERNSCIPNDMNSFQALLKEELLAYVASKVAQRRFEGNEDYQVPEGGLRKLRQRNAMLKIDELGYRAKREPEMLRVHRTVFEHNWPNVPADEWWKVQGDELANKKACYNLLNSGEIEKHLEKRLFEWGMYPVPPPE